MPFPPPHPVAKSISRFVIDLWAIAAIVWASWTVLRPLSRPVPGGAFFVSPQGSDRNAGLTRERPLRTIQRAADLVAAGEQIVILPGTYQERVHLRRGGEPTRPVIIRADQPGTVLLTWSRPLIADWRDEGNGIWSAAVDAPIYRVSSGGETFFRVPWGGVSALRKLIARPNAWGAFWYDEPSLRLYLARKNQTPPAATEILIPRATPGPREWGEFKSANLSIEAPHVEVRGLRLEFGIGAAVLLWDTTDVSIVDCEFSETNLGVKGSGGLRNPARIQIDHCLYQNFPQWYWHRDWLPWHEIYAAYSCCSLASLGCDATQITNCVVSHAGDGIQWTTPVDAAVGGDAQGNLIAQCTDDAVEFDGPAVKIHFHDNVILDCHESLGISPITHGPAIIDHNLFLHPTIDVNGANLKLMNNDPRPGIPPDEINNVEVRHNQFFGNWLCWWNNVPIHNVRVHDNEFTVRYVTAPVWPPGVSAEENRIEVDPTFNVDMNKAAAHPTWQQILKNHVGPRWNDWKRHPAIPPFLQENAAGR